MCKTVHPGLYSAWIVKEMVRVIRGKLRADIAYDNQNDSNWLEEYFYENQVNIIVPETSTSTETHISKRSKYQASSHWKGDQPSHPSPRCTMCPIIKYYAWLYVSATLYYPVSWTYKAHCNDVYKQNSWIKCNVWIKKTCIVTLLLAHSSLQGTWLRIRSWHGLPLKFAT